MRRVALLEGALAGPRMLPTNDASLWLGISMKR